MILGPTCLTLRGEPRSVNILIVDDHPIVVSGFKALLEADGGMSVHEAASAQAAEQLLGTLSPDVSVVDINLPGLSGFELARRMIEREPSARVVMFSMNDDPVFVAQAMEIGAKGFVSKNENPAHMLRAIRAVAAGGTAWPAGITERLAHLGERGAGGGQAALSGRDSEILRLLAKGKSLYEVADVVGVSYKTVATSCAALRLKLNARTQTELIAIAKERKLV
jgi:two-component system, NarL family, invasion response regulator UvrY